MYIRIRSMQILVIPTLALVCAGCAYSPAEPLLRKYATSNSISAFQVCRDYGCQTSVTASFNAQEWDRIRALFSPAPRNAGEERAQIQHAIALIETMVGPKAGTENDLAGATILSFDHEGQLDCIDEAYNSSTYLKLMAGDGLLKWHDVGEPARRGYIFNRWPHNTATVIDRSDRTPYTVDSWFHANGALPEVVPLADWLDGWSPADA